MFLVGLSILYSVLFNHTQGSLLTAVLLHASTDFGPRLLDTARFSILSWDVVVGLTWIAAGVLYWVTRRDTVVT